MPWTRTASVAPGGQAPRNGASILDAARELGIRDAQEHGDPLGDAGADQVAGGAAVAAGIAFALVRNDLWERPPAEDRNYLLQCAIWALAWAPRACSRSRGQRLHRRDASVSGRFRGRAIFDSTARHVRGVIGPYSRRRTASASTSEGSPNPRPYPNKSATVLEPNRLSSSSS